MGRVVAVALLIAVLVAGLAAPVMVELLSWDSSPTIRRGQQIESFGITLAAASLASLLGTWVGALTASDGRPLPGWRAGKWSAAATVGLVFVFLPLGTAVILLVPPALLAASTSGAVAAPLLRKGTHGKA